MIKTKKVMCCDNCGKSRDVVIDEESASSMARECAWGVGTKIHLCSNCISDMFIHHPFWELRPKEKNAGGGSV